MSKVFLVEECGVEERDSIQRRAIFLVFKNRDRERESKRYALSLRGCCLGAIRPLFLAPSLPQAPFFLVSLSSLPACLLALRWIECEAALQGERERENQRDRSLWWGAGARKTVTHRLSGGNRNVLPPSGAESVSSSFSLSVAVKVFFFLLLFSSLFCVCIPLVRPPLSRRPAAVCGSANALIQSTLVRSFVRSLARSTHPLIHQSESHFIDRLFVACSALACVRAGEGNDDHDHDESSA